MCGDDNEAKVDHKEGADDDQHHKVDPVPEGVSILKFLVLKISEVLLLNTLSAIGPCQTSNLYKVHDISPPLERDDEEDGDPGEANIVEGDRAIERVGRARCALGVVLVPVDAAVLAVPENRFCTNVQAYSLYLACSTVRKHSLPSCL